MRNKRSHRSHGNGVLPAFTAILVIGGGIAAWGWQQRQHVPVDSFIQADVSASMLNSGQFETLAHTVCSEIKHNIFEGDTFTLMPFAKTSSVTHAIEIDNRLAALGLCNKGFQQLLEQREVATNQGTSLHNAFEGLQLQIAQTPTASQGHGKVISLMVHADDQGTGAKHAIPLSETAELAFDLLDDNSSLVIFAVDTTLQQQLSETFDHPRIRISPLSEPSIRHSLTWAYRTARTSPGE